MTDTDKINGLTTENTTLLASLKRATKQIGELMVETEVLKARLAAAETERDIAKDRIKNHPDSNGDDLRINALVASERKLKSRVIELEEKIENSTWMSAYNMPHTKSSIDDMLDRLIAVHDEKKALYKKLNAFGGPMSAEQWKKFSPFQVADKLVSEIILIANVITDEKDIRL